MSASSQPLNEVQAAVLRLHDEAQLSFDHIARQLDVSTRRVRQIYRVAATRAADLAANGPHALCLLPARARWVVHACGYHSRAEVRTAMEAGELVTWNRGAAVFWHKTMLRGVGHKTWFALYKWAGQPVLPPRS
jgi:hypothetical protein